MKKRCQFCGYNKTLSIISHIIDKDGEQIICPNCSVKKILDGTLKFKDNPDFIDDITGKPGAVKYFDAYSGYVLNSKTLTRLLKYNLLPNEYKILAKKYSPHDFMLHEDFYNEDGIAMQPLED